MVGTLTDGDIRRGLLHGEKLDVPAERLMNRKFRFVRSSEDQATVLEMMRTEVLRQIPVLRPKAELSNCSCWSTSQSSAAQQRCGDNGRW